LGTIFSFSFSSTDEHAEFLVIWKLGVNTENIYIKKYVNFLFNKVKIFFILKYIKLIFFIL